MITMDQKLRDVKRDKSANFWLENYVSVPEINRLFRLMAPFKFKTLEKLLPKGAFDCRRLRQAHSLPCRPGRKPLLSAERR